MEEDKIIVLCNKCGHNEEQPEHSCPYDADINGVDFHCNCCAECERDCLDDI